MGKFIEPECIRDEPGRTRIVEFGLLFPRAVWAAHDKVTATVDRMVLEVGVEIFRVRGNFRPTLGLPGCIP